ncbi:hypothetical protein, partial [Nocardia salmonicida]|uniref:hypothetical protein n=1 Tax=Nocardia salmonicida TaxID=53431 RepID=UPI0036475503
MRANREPDAALAYDDIGMSVQHRGPEGSLSEALSRVVVGVLGVIAIRRDEAMIALPGARARLLPVSYT